MNVATESPVINWARLRESAAEDPEFERELIEMFLDDQSLRVAAIESAIRQSDMEILQREAHAEKGASASMGAERLREVALALETAGRQHQPSDCPELLDRLRREHEIAAQVLRAALAA